MILKLLTKQFLHYLQCSDYTTTDKVTAPIFVILLSLKYTVEDENLENVTSDGFRLFEFLHYHGLRDGGTCKFLPRTLSKVYCSSLDF